MEILRVFGSTSQRISFAPHQPTTCEVATYVTHGTMTSSPGPTPRAFKAKNNPAVQEFTATALKLGFSRYSSKEFSKRETTGPVVSQPDFKTSATAAISDSSIQGFPTGIN